MNLPPLLVAMLPEHLLLAGILGILVAGLVSRDTRYPLAFTVLVAAAAAAAALWLHVADYAGAPFPGQFSVDPSASLAKAVVLALAVPVVLLSREDFAEARFPVLLLSSLYGVCLLMSADSFLTLFLGIELMSLPVYVLVLLAFTRVQSAEAALKYLILGGAGSATLLLGIAFLLGATGTLSLSAFQLALATDGTLARAGIALVLAAFFVKAAVVPFHTWAPDAYQGASVSVTAYMATLVKAGVLVAAVRLLGDTAIPPAAAGLVALLPLASMVWGNLAAMRQEGFRRLIAYSSIAHAGFLFFALLGAPPGRFAAVTFYVIAYGLANILGLACLPAGDDASRDRLDQLKGLFVRQPYAAVGIAIAMLSLAGIPPFPGFVAKFLVFRNVMEAGFTVYAVAGLVASYLGIYFYLRVIQYMFMTAAGPAPTAGFAGRGAALLASALCLVPVLLLIVFPGWVIDRL